MSKPDWKDAPEWGKFVAMDRDGVWYWHENDPEPRIHDWASNGRMRRATDTSRADWLTAMEPRP